MFFKLNIILKRDPNLKQGVYWQVPFVLSRDILSIFRYLYFLHSSRWSFFIYIVITTFGQFLSSYVRVSVDFLRSCDYVEKCLHYIGDVPYEFYLLLFYCVFFSLRIKIIQQSHDVLLYFDAILTTQFSPVEIFFNLVRNYNRQNNCSPYGCSGLSKVFSF